MGIVKLISVTWDCNAFSVTESSEPEYCLQKSSTFVSLLLHTDTLGHAFYMVDIQAKIHLRFR